MQNNNKVVTINNMIKHNDSITEKFFCTPSTLTKLFDNKKTNNILFYVIFKKKNKIFCI